MLVKSTTYEYCNDCKFWFPITNVFFLSFFFSFSFPHAVEKKLSENSCLSQHVNLYRNTHIDTRVLIKADEINQGKPDTYGPLP